MNRGEDQYRSLQTALFGLLLLIVPVAGDWLIRRWRAEMAKFYQFSLWPAMLHYLLILLFGLALGAWQNDIALRKWRNGGLAFDRARGVPIILVCSVALLLWYMKLLAYGDMLPTLAACLLGYGVSSSCSVRQPGTGTQGGTD